MTMQTKKSPSIFDHLDKLFSSMYSSFYKIKLKQIIFMEVPVYWTKTIFVLE